MLAGFKLVIALKKEIEFRIQKSLVFDCQFLSEAVRIVRCKATPRHCSYFESKETSSRARNRLEGLDGGWQMSVVS